MVLLRREVRTLGFFGRVLKVVFILFNVLMAVWLVAYLSAASNLYQSAGSDPARGGTAVGATLATGYLVFLWGAGDLILGLLVLQTRGKPTILEENQNEPTR